MPEHRLGLPRNWAVKTSLLLSWSQESNWRVLSGRRIAPGWSLFWPKPVFGNFNFGPNIVKKLHAFNISIEFPRLVMLQSEL